MAGLRYGDQLRVREARPHALRRRLRQHLRLAAAHDQHRRLYLRQLLPKIGRIPVVANAGVVLERVLAVVQTFELMAEPVAQRVVRRRLVRHPDQRQGDVRVIQHRMAVLRDVLIQLERWTLLMRDRRRNIDHHQMADAPRVVGRVGNAVHAAHRQADHIEPLQPPAVGQRRYVGNVVICREVRLRRPRALPVAALVQRDDPVAVLERASDRVPDTAQAGQPVQHQDHRSVRLAPLYVVKAQAARLDSMLSRFNGGGHRMPPLLDVNIAYPISPAQSANFSCRNPSRSEASCRYLT